MAEGNAHITITDSSLEDEDVLQGRTEIIANTTDNKIPLEADADYWAEEIMNDTVMV